MPEFLSIEEVCRLLHAPKQSIYKWTSAHEIPHYKIGKRLLFDRDEILAWIESRKVGVK